MIIIAPTLSKTTRDEFQRLNCQVAEQEPGRHRIDGATFSAWILETDALAEREPLLAFFSRLFQRDRRRIMEKLLRTHSSLLYFMLQQVEQFTLGSEEYLMQLKDADQLE